MNVFIDIETRSEIDLKKAGQYVYADHPSTEILMIAWAIDDGPVKVWIPFFKEPMPAELDYFLHHAAGLTSAYDKDFEAYAGAIIRLIAHNASFERVLLSSQAGRKIGIPDLSDVTLWDCTAAWAACLGLPRTLDGAAAALGLSDRKDNDGHKLMLKLSKPRKPRKSEVPDLMPGAALWHESPEEISRFAEYCMQDVTVERAVWRVLQPLSPTERRVWELTERMNDRGVPVDVALLERMLVMIADAEKRLNDTISARTRTAEQIAADPDNHRKTAGAVPRVSDHMALTRWLMAQGIDDAEETGVAKAAVAAMIENPEIDALIREVLILRQEGGGVSPKKWRAIKQRISADGCIHGALIYCGAASTQRWCLAEGMPILVKSQDGRVSEKPIESVLLSDRVWDGDEWVCHGGVVFSGEKDVIEYDNVTATKDHKVYHTDDAWVTLDDASESGVPLFKGRGDPWV